MIKSIIHYFFAFLFFIKITFLIGQNELPTVSKKDIRKAIPCYIGIRSGLNFSLYRDFATSPLFYTGEVPYLSLNRLKANQFKENNIGISSFFGKYSNYYNSHFTLSNVTSIMGSFDKLYKLNRFKSDKYSIKVGGKAVFIANLRINYALQNNSFGIELLPTLMASAKVEKNMSRVINKEKKILFLKYKLNPRVRQLSYRLNVGVVNNSYRNGYAYTGQSSILNNYVVFDAYEFKIFSGFQTGSELDYTWSLNNKNKIQCSYAWNVIKTGGSLDKFEMANHILSMSLLFNTNNK